MGSGQCFCYYGKGNDLADELARSIAKVIDPLLKYILLA